MDGIHPTKLGMQQIADAIIELTSGTEMLYPPETEALHEPETEMLHNSGEANIAVLEDTLQIFRNGAYQRDGRTVKCASLKQLSQAKVYLPDDIASLQKANRKRSPFIHNCSIVCENKYRFFLSCGKAVAICWAILSYAQRSCGSIGAKFRESVQSRQWRPARSESTRRGLV